MPRKKEFLRWMGTVAEEKYTYETTWVQMAGSAVVRCDDNAKKGHHGAWTMVAPRQASYWMGRGDHIKGLDHANWIRENYTEDVYAECDYS